MPDDPVTIAKREVKVKGPKGELNRSLPPLVDATVEGDELIVTQAAKGRRGRAMPVSHVRVRSNKRTSR